MLENENLGTDAADEYCACTVIHEEAVTKARSMMPCEESLLEAADLFKMFADSTRVKIIAALLHTELCVCDIAALLAMTKSAISHQLRLLRQSKLVRTRRDGKIVYYSLDDDHVHTILTEGLNHVTE
ncbi:MAG: metalloregulator ArsR/SmtB family transcription factor [Spirochaetaceae bacterium]|jgi:ArsR family transcriptional regulator|nr:metalloregulator ArsR/SmtB family transcription factor [Spirochaetaceae bacterium]